MIRAVLCDLDGVLRIWPSCDGIEDEHGLPRAALLGAAFEPALLHRAVTGKLTDEEWRELVAVQLEAEHGTRARGAVEAWARMKAPVDTEMLALVAELRARVPVVLLTNATTRLGADLDATGLSSAFDAIANSAELGVAKPDPEVFRRAAELVGVAAADAVLVDDTELHLAGARKAGCATVLHRDAASTREALHALGLWSDRHASGTEAAQSPPVRRLG